MAGEGLLRGPNLVQYFSYDEAFWELLIKSVVKIGTIALFLVHLETEKYNGTPMANILHFQIILRFRLNQILYYKITCFIFISEV